MASWSFESSSYSKESENTDLKCSSCHEQIDRNDFEYKCLEPICLKNNYSLCSVCFERGLATHDHKRGHPLVRITEPEHFFGRKYNSEELSLEQLQKDFENVEHDENLKCKLCPNTIKGLWFKCEKSELCQESNFCYNCFNKQIAATYPKNYDIIVMANNLTQLIDFENITDTIEKEGGHKKGKYNNVDVFCKKFSYTTADVIDQNVFYFYMRRKRQPITFEKIKGKNIAKFYGIFYTESNTTGLDEYYIVTEFISDKNLKNLLSEITTSLSIKDRLEIAEGIASGMYRIHRLGFIHRRIRPENIYITKYNVPKIADMEFAKNYVRKDNTPMPNDSYMPKEAESGNYDQKIDVFMFGSTMVELFDLKIFPKIKDEKVLKTYIDHCRNDDSSKRPESYQVKYKLIYHNKFIKEKMVEKMMKKDSINMDEENKIFLSAYGSMKLSNKNCEEIEISASEWKLISKRPINMESNLSELSEASEPSIDSKKSSFRSVISRASISTSNFLRNLFQK